VHFGPDGTVETRGHRHPEDVDGDGDVDLLLHFRTQESGLTISAQLACLTGQTSDGVAFEGCDIVRTVSQ
jgi:hypothetical protein